MSREGTINPRSSAESNVVQTDESSRRISEVDYSGCWKEKEFPKGTALSLSRYYKWDQPPEILKQLAYQGDAEIAEAKDWKGDVITGIHEVKYKIDMEKLGLPESFPISEFQNIDFLLAYHDIYEKLNIDPVQRKQILGVLLHKAAEKLLDTAEELRKKRIIQKKEHFITEDRRMEIFEPWLDNNDYPYSLIELRERFPELAKESDKDVIVKTKETLRKSITERAKGEESKNSLLAKLDEDVGGYDIGDDLTPHAMLFFDDWIDSRFINGVIPAGVARGTIRITGGGADKDAPALIELYRDGQSKLKNTVQRFGAVLYVPPNMTNSYLVRVPAITPEISEIETTSGLELADDGNCQQQDRVNLIFCEHVDALHPTKIPDRLDKKFGKDKYVFLRNGKNSLIQMIPKNKKDWEVKFRRYGTSQNETSRQNIPFPNEPHLNWTFDKAV